MKALLPDDEEPEAETVDIDAAAADAEENSDDNTENAEE